MFQFLNTDDPVMTTSDNESYVKIPGSVIFDGDFADYTEIEDFYNTVMAILCVLCGGLAAGLTVGLLSFDVTKLEVKLMIGSNEEKKAAESIIPIVKRHHLLLVTLLLFNSIANETLPIFLGTLVPNYIAVIISVTLVLVFGEIIPTALCTGSNQLLLAARYIGLVYFLLFIFYPIAYPIGKLLDYLIGTEEGSSSISREELEAIVKLQSADYQRLSRENSLILRTSSSHDNLTFLAKSSTNKQRYHALETEDDNNDDLNLGSLSSYEVNLMTGILKLSRVTVKDAMIPIKNVFMISSSTKLDEKSMYDILDCGFSRIPVFKRKDKQHVMGYLLVKELIVVRSEEEAMMVEDLILREPLCVKPSMGLMDMLRTFQDGQCHLALVSLDPVKTLEYLRNGERPTDDAITLGLVTMEDILEKIIQSDIMDETDHLRRPSVFPKGGAPTIFYHNLRRGNHGGITNNGKGGLRVIGKVSKKQRRRMMSISGSVVHSEYSNLILRKSSPNPNAQVESGRESLVHVNMEMQDVLRGFGCVSIDENDEQQSPDGIELRRNDRMPLGVDKGEEVKEDQSMITAAAEQEDVIKPIPGKRQPMPVDWDDM